MVLVKCWFVDTARSSRLSTALEGHMVLRVGKVGDFGPYIRVCQEHREVCVGGGCGSEKAMVAAKGAENITGMLL